MTPYRILMFAVTLLLLALAGGAKASPTLPPEKAFTAWFAAFNAGNHDDLQAVITRYGLRQTAQRDVDLRQAMGHFRLLEMRSSTPEQAEAIILAEPSERALLVTVQMTPGSTQQVSHFQLEGVETPARYQPVRMALPALVAAFTERLNEQAAADMLSGAVLVARNGETVMRWQGGLADRAQRRAIEANTRFRLASAGKMFTAVAVLQLADAGKLSLDDTVGLHLRDYPNQTVARTVTIRQLLNHTSGLGDIFDDRFKQQAASLRTLADYCTLYATDPLAFTPGSKDQYSNYGYIVLGRIIEVVSGQSYYDYVDQHIYRVAGMQDTGSAPESEGVPGLAIAYTRDAGQWTAESASLPWRGTSAGGGYSTLGDMLKFAEALRTGKLVPTERLQAATSPQNNNAWYGYGFMVSGKDDQRQYGHTGGAPGMNVSFAVLPAQGWVLVGLSNVDPTAMEDTMGFVARRLPL